MEFFVVAYDSCITFEMSRTESSVLIPVFCDFYGDLRKFDVLIDQYDIRIILAMHLKTWQIAGHRVVPVYRVYKVVSGWDCIQLSILRVNIRFKVQDSIH